MLEGHLIIQNGAATFGRLQEPADDGAILYTTTFVDASGLTVAIIWKAETVREFLENALASMAGVVPVPKPRLEIVRTLPPLAPA